MGYHIILEVHGILKDEYTDFPFSEVFLDEQCDIEPKWRWVVDKWQELGIGHNFYKLDVENGEIKIMLQKKHYRHHHGFLHGEPS
jgi:hypothetical protein